MNIRKAAVISLTAAICFAVFGSGCKDGTNGKEEKSYGYDGTVEGVAFSLPALGDNVGVHTELQNAYIASKQVGSIYTLTVDGRSPDGVHSYSAPSPVQFEWQVTGGGSDQVLSVSENADMTNGWTFETSETSYAVYNLKIDTKYYWTVSVGEVTSGVASFTTESGSPRNLYVDGVENVRDVGGWVTSSGARTKQGMIIRGGRLNVDYSKTASVTEEGIKTLTEELGVKTEIDLRGGRTNGDTENGSLKKSVLGDSVNYRYLQMEWKYNMVEEESNRESLKEIFKILADEQNYPVYYHCSIGTDRTGCLSFLINALLGVEENDLYRDYLWSNYANIGGKRELGNITQTNYAYTIRNYEGSDISEKAYRYAVQEIGIAAEDIAALKQIMLG